jgi:hypothetical protein
MNNFILTECNVEFLKKLLLNQYSFPIPSDYRNDHWLFLVDVLTNAPKEMRQSYLTSAIELLKTTQCPQDEELTAKLFSVLTEVGNENLLQFNSTYDKIIEWFEFTSLGQDKYDMRREILFLLGRCLLPNKDWAPLIEAELKNENYVIATYMALEHQYPKKYAERLPEVLKLLEDNNIPNQWFLFCLEKK